MPSTLFPFSDPAVVALGGLGGQATFVGRLSQPVQGAGVQIEFLAQGASATVPYNSSDANALSITISDPDGSNAVTTTPALTTGNVWTDLTLTLAEGVFKRVKIRFLSANVRVEVNNFITVTGAAPALQIVPGYAQSVQISALSSLIKLSNADISVSQFVFSNVANFSKQDCALRLPPSNMSGFRFYAFCNGGKFRVAKKGADGQFVYVSATLATPNVGSWQLVDVPLSLDASVANELMIVCTKGNLFIRSIMPIDGTIGSISATAFAPGFVVGYGDSNIAGEFGAPQDTSIGGKLNKIMLLSGRAVVNRGESGQSVTGSSGFATASRLNTVTGIAGISNANNRIICEGGVNDVTNNVDAATFQTAYTQMLNGLLSGTTLVPIDCELIPPQVSQSAPLRAQCNQAIKDAVASVNNTRVRWIDVSAGINATQGADTSDGTHWNDSGSTKLAQNYLKSLLPAFIPALFKRRRVQSRSALAGIR